MPATIRPVLPSLLTSACTAEGGAVHAEVTSATFGDAFSCVTMSVPTARAGALCAPSSDVTEISIGMSPWPNFSDSSRAACDDCDAGSWKPPAERLLMTGIPKIAVPAMTSRARAMIRLGAAMASRAIPCSTSPASHPAMESAVRVVGRAHLFEARHVRVGDELRRTPAKVLVGQRNTGREVRHRRHVRSCPVAVPFVVGRVLPDGVERQVDLVVQAAHHVR